MKLTSTSWVNGDRIPARYAAGRIAAGGGVEFSDNVNPHLAWAELPPGSRSLVLPARSPRASTATASRRAASPARRRCAVRATA
jgi:phosphatidylethanolamine-binding protein (PEBP) family uncharacterized protein